MSTTSTITVNFQESIVLYMLIEDRINLCDKNWKTSLLYGDEDGAEYWIKEKNLATQLQHKLDGVI